mgnify:CR=1 FL=1
MDNDSAITALGALAQGTRLDAFRLLVRHEPEGLAAGEVAKALGLSDDVRDALAGFDGWITGRKRFQAETRHNVGLYEPASDGKLKINPLAYWSKQDIDAHFVAFDLPQHPLVEHGYPSIGCAACTSPVHKGEDIRAGRWRGSDKTECGIHFENGKLVRGAAAAGE